MENRNSVGSFVTGLVIGGVVGAVTSLFLAPQSGEETRTQIQEKGVEIKQRVEETYADMQARLESALTDLRTRVDELSAKVDQALVRGKEAIARERLELEGTPEEKPAPEAEAAKA
jgi:gas vesicle protein